jgi:hypothetical protein
MWSLRKQISNYPCIERWTPRSSRGESQGGKARLLATRCRAGLGPPKQRIRCNLSLGGGRGSDSPRLDRGAHEVAFAATAKEKVVIRIKIMKPPECCGAAPNRMDPTVKPWGVARGKDALCLRRLLATRCRAGLGPPKQRIRCIQKRRAEARLRGAKRLMLKTNRS